MTSTLYLDLMDTRQTLLKLLQQLDTVEKDQQISDSDKLLQIQKIKLQLEEIAIRIDNFKREIKLLNEHKVN